MPFNVLLLPLLGGYLFISHWNHTRFDARRYSGERLVFHAATAGVVFLAVAFLITRLLILSKPELHAWWRGLVPFPYTGTSLLAFTLAATAWKPLNGLINDRDSEQEKAVEQWGDFLELLLQRSMKDTMQVSITLSSGKVYIGFVTSNFDPAFERRYIRLLPMLSGYRDAATKDLIISRDYARAYQRLIEEDNALLIEAADRFQVVIPIPEIASANLFDPDVYSVFRALDVDLAEETEPIPAGGDANASPPTAS